MFIGPRAVVNARANVAGGVIVNTAAVIEHDCHIGQFAHVAPGAVVAGGSHVGRSTLVGCNATVINGLRIGDYVTLAAGAVAVADIPDGVKALGVPARVMSSSDIN